MAVYKVAQDVEADDKLIGPFSFRQFIYLIVVAIAIVVAWGLSHLFIGLAILPLPVILFFGALALPLRKDQPMEVYLAALVSYYLKPRKRMWSSDGVESLVEITVPKLVEVQRTKEFDEAEAERRLSYLADIADTRGWAVRHAAQPTTNSSMITDAYFEAQQTVDVMDDSGGVAQSFNTMIAEADERRKQEMVAKMHQAPAPQSASRTAATPVTPQAAPATAAPQPVVDDAGVPTPTFNPYPSAMHQSVIQPLSARPRPSRNSAQPQPTVSAQNPPATTSETSVSPDIINLANNTDLSIETIQREANRIQKKAEAEDNEVFISLH